MTFGEKITADTEKRKLNFWNLISFINLSLLIEIYCAFHLVLAINNQSMTGSKVVVNEG